MIKQRGTIRKSCDSCRNRDTLRMKNLPILEQQPQTAFGGLYSYNLALIQIRGDLALEPDPVIDETLKADRLSRRDATQRMITIQRQRTTRIGYMRSRPGRAQEHALRHVVFPEFQRPAKDACFDLGCPEMGHSRQSIRACADNCNLTS